MSFLKKLFGQGTSKKPLVKQWQSKLSVENLETRLVPALVAPSPFPIPHPTPPAAPVLSATAVSPTQVDLAWNSVAGASGYLVEVDVPASGGYAQKQVASLGSGTTSYAVTGLSPDIDYGFFVEAFNAGGYTPSAAKWATTLAETPASITWMSAPTSVNAGAGFTLTLTAKDQWGDLCNGTFQAHLSALDGQAVQPASTTVTFVNGTAMITGVKLDVADKVGLTVSVGTATGTLEWITVNPDTAVSFAVSAPSTAIAGAPISISVTAKDAFGNIATSTSGTLTFTTSDGQAIYGQSGFTFKNGVAAGTLELHKADTLTLTAKSGAISAASGKIVVGAAAAANVAVSAPASVGESQLFNVTFTVTDMYGNPVNGTVTVLLETSSFQLSNVPFTGPKTLTLTNGKATGTYSIGAVGAFDNGSYKIAAVDPAGSVVGYSADISVAYIPLG